MPSATTAAKMDISMNTDNAPPQASYPFFCLKSFSKASEVHPAEVQGSLEGQRSQHPLGNLLPRRMKVRTSMSQHLIKGTTLTRILYDSSEVCQQDRSPPVHSSNACTLYWLSPLPCLALPIPSLPFPGIISQKTACTEVLVSGSAFRRTQIKTLVKEVYFSFPRRKMLLFIHACMHSFFPDKTFKALSG